MGQWDFIVACINNIPGRKYHHNIVYINDSQSWTAFIWCQMDCFLEAISDYHHWLLHLCLTLTAAYLAVAWFILMQLHKNTEMISAEPSFICSISLHLLLHKITKNIIISYIIALPLISSISSDIYNKPPSQAFLKIESYRKQHDTNHRGFFYKFQLKSINTVDRKRKRRGRANLWESSQNPELGNAQQKQNYDSNDSSLQLECLVLWVFEYMF